MTARLSVQDRFYQKNTYIKIRDLFKDGKNKSVIKKATEYLDLFPNDIQVRFMRSKCYRKMEMFNEAINDLKYNLNLELNEHSLASLYFIYYYLNMYEEAIKLLPLLYETRCINAHSVSISELVMKKQLGMEINVKESVYKDYIKRQILDYNEEEALNKISTRENKIVENDSYFNNNVNLKYLFDIAKESIKEGKKVNTEEMLEIYYFGVSNIGYINNNTCNFIKVVVIPNTNNIISMYPTTQVDYNYISNINIDYDKLFEKNNKVKTISRIDKFNKKYNI